MTEFLRKLFFPDKQGIVIGGAGALGSAIVNRFSKTWSITSIDFKPNKSAKLNIILDESQDTEIHAQQIEPQLKGKYDLIMCTAGAWCQGEISSHNIFSQFDLNFRYNLYPSLLAGYLATKYLTETGMLVFSGSLLSFKENTPSMLAYGTNKNMIHSLALNMSVRNELTTENLVICILPDILNTEVNRKAMPNADFGKWTSPNVIADLVFMWNRGVNTPKNGSYVGFNSGKEFIQEYL